MSGQIIILQQRPWAYERESSIRLSFDNFHILAQKHLQDIKTALDSVFDANQLFSEEEDIWQDQCDYAIASIQTLSEPLQGFSQLLDNATHLPLAITPLRYQLIMKIHYVNEQILKLKLLLSTFRSMCQISSKQVAKLRYEIHCQLESLLYEDEDILQKSYVLFDQARFFRNND